MKFKNARVLAALVITLSLILSACGDAIKTDLVNYDKSCVSALKTMNDVEKSITEADANNLGKVLKENSEKLYSAKKSIESIDLKTQEVKDVSSIFIDAMGLTADGCKAMGEAAENPEKADEAVVQEAQNKIQKGADRFNEFSTKYEELANKHGLKVEK